MNKFEELSMSDQVAYYLDMAVQYHAAGNDTECMRCNAMARSILRRQRAIKITVDAFGVLV